jgi:hypothetical protein
MDVERCIEHSAYKILPYNDYPLRPTYTITRPTQLCQSSAPLWHVKICSCNERRRRRRVVLERGRDGLLGLVVAGEAVDTGLDEDEAELGVLVLTVDLEVLAHSDGLLHEVPEILRDLGRQAYIARRQARISSRHAQASKKG